MRGLWWALAGFGVACLALAVVLTIFGAESEKDETVDCLTHLKIMAMGMSIYQADFDERLPGRGDWADATYPYVKTWGAFHCPRVPRGAWGYAFNGVLDRKDPESLGSPADLILLYDSTDLRKNAWDRVTSLPRPGRHEGKNRAAYADGNAKAVK